MATKRGLLQTGLLAGSLIGLPAPTHSQSVSQLSSEPCPRLIEEIRKQPRTSRPLPLRTARQFARQDYRSACEVWLGRLNPRPAIDSQSQENASESARVRRMEVGQLLDLPVVDRTGLRVGHVNQIIQRAGGVFVIVTDSLYRGEPRHFRLPIESLALGDGNLIVENAARRRIWHRAQTPLQQRGVGLTNSTVIRIAVSTTSDPTADDTYAKLPTTSGLRSSAEYFEAKARRQRDRELPGEPADSSTASEPIAEPDQIRAGLDSEQISVERLRRMMLYNENLDAIADVERVVRDAQGRIGLVVGMALSPGFRQKHVAVSLGEVSWRRNRLVIDGVTRGALSQRPHWESSAFQDELPADGQVNVPRA